MKKILILFGVMAMPALAFAADVNNVLSTISDLLGKAVTLLISVAVVYFVWGTFKYISADGPDDRSEGRQKMIHGIIGIFVIISLWGIISVLGNTFDLGGSGVQPGPDVPSI